MDSLSVPHRMRRASLQSLPTTEVYHARAGSPADSLSSNSHHGHKRSMSSFPITRATPSQSGYRPSSIVSSITTEEEVEDNADMGSPVVPKQGRPSSTDEGHARTEVALLSHSRHRSTSSYSLARSDLYAKPLLVRPHPLKPVPRPIHFSHEVAHSAYSDKQPRMHLHRSQTSPYTSTGQYLGSSSSQARLLAATDLRRTGSEGAQRNDGSQLRLSQASQTKTDGHGNQESSRRSTMPSSPGVAGKIDGGSARSSFDLDRSSSDIGWLGWGRKRLSSMASSSKYEAPGGHGARTPEGLADIGLL